MRFCYLKQRYVVPHSKMSAVCSRPTNYPCGRRPNTDQFLFPSKFYVDIVISGRSNGRFFWNDSFPRQNKRVVLSLGMWKKFHFPKMLSRAKTFSDQNISYNRFMVSYSLPRRRSFGSSRNLSSVTSRNLSLRYRFGLCKAVPLDTNQIIGRTKIVSFLFFLCISFPGQTETRTRRGKKKMMADNFISFVLSIPRVCCLHIQLASRN